MAKIREITSGLRAPEGPVALKDGSVLVVELKGVTLTRVALDGLPPNYKGGSIQRVDLASGKWS